MSENAQKWAYRLLVIFTPFVISVLLAIQAELGNEGGINWKIVAGGAISALILAVANFYRALTEPKPEQLPAPEP